jgi:hypothetical protein
MVSASLWVGWLFSGLVAYFSLVYTMADATITIEL